MTQQGIDSRAMLAVFITRLPRLLILAVAGAVAGSGLNLLVVLIKAQSRCYVSETEYYVEFDKGQDEARHWYNDFTWNDVLATDLILGRAMELLGTGYERGQVKEMLNADILSDVRYLTITVRGQDEIQVEAVKNALGTALEEFGAAKKEFASITKIEDNAITQEALPYFAWRAALLGAVLAAGIGSFVTAFCFCLGSVFYTKGDITARLGLPVCGMTVQEGRRKAKVDGTLAGRQRAKVDGALEARQAQMLAEGLGMLAEKYSRILLMDASGGQEAAAFLKEISDMGIRDKEKTKNVCFEIGNGDGQKMQEAVIVAVIPFGRTYRERIADEIDFARQYGGRVVAAVLTQVDKRWAHLYYAQSKKGY